MFFFDGKKTPYELKEMYKDKGYSILSITDHETPKNHSYLSDSDFLAITGYETYVRPNADCRCDVYDKEIHINLFARDPQNEAIVCYNSKYCKYITDEQKEKYKKVGSQRTREYSVEYINELIKTANLPIRAAFLETSSVFKHQKISAFKFKTTHKSRSRKRAGFLLITSYLFTLTSK